MYCDQCEWKQKMKNDSEKTTRDFPCKQWTSSDIVNGLMFSANQSIALTDALSVKSTEGTPKK